MRNGIRDRSTVGRRLDVDRLELSSTVKSGRSWIFSRVVLVPPGARHHICELRDGARGKLLSTEIGRCGSQEFGTPEIVVPTLVVHLLFMSRKRVRPSDGEPIDICFD